MPGNPTTNAISTATIQIADLLGLQATLLTRTIGPLVAASTQILSQEYLSVPPAGIVISLGQSYGMIFLRNVSTATMIVTITTAGPISQNWTLPPGAFLLYAVQTPANPTLAMPLTSVTIAPQAVTTQNFPFEYLFAQAT